MYIFLVVVCGTSDTAEEVSVVKHTADVTSCLGSSTSCSTHRRMIAFNSAGCPP